MISGTTRSSLIQFRKTLGFISSGMLDIENVITDRYGITDINEAFSNAEQAKGLKHVICYD